VNFEHVFERGTSERTVLALHGTGGNEHDLIPVAKMVAPPANILSPRGNISENGALRFFKRLAEGVFDIEDLKLRTHELADFVREAATEYEFDPSNVYALGFSNGANIASSLLLLRPEVLAGGAILRGMVPLDMDKGELEQLPDLTGKKIFLANGTRDPVVPLDNAKKLAEMYKQAGATVTHEVNPASHGLIQSDLQTMQRWFSQLTTSN
jgi:phospholipase/carboxylesterase